MQIKDSRFHKVWKVYEENGFKKIDIGDSKKKKDGGYDNWTWFKVGLFGNAKLEELNEGDVITILSGQITQRKYNDKWYNDIVIFDLEVTQRVEKKQDDFADFDDLPFSFD